MCDRRSPRGGDRHCTRLADLGDLTLAIGLAFVFGYALTLRSVLGSGIAFRVAIGIALTADTLSIAVMELIDNAVPLAVPGAMDAGLGDARFCLALAGALAVAFLVTWPVNAWMIDRVAITRLCTDCVESITLSCQPVPGVARNSLGLDTPVPAP